MIIYYNEQKPYLPNLLQRQIPRAYPLVCLSQRILKWVGRHVVGLALEALQVLCQVHGHVVLVVHDLHSKQLLQNGEVLEEVLVGKLAGSLMFHLNCKEADATLKEQ